MNNRAQNNREVKIFKRGLAIGLSKEKASVQDISQQLNLNRATVFRWISQFNRENKRAPTKSSGRPYKTTPRSNRLLCRLATQHHLSSARELRQFWNEQTSLRTVYNRLKTIGIRKRRRARCPFLTMANKTTRLHWAMAHVIWRDAWERVLFSDEKRFRRVGNDGRIRVWRRSGERFNPRNLTATLQCGGGSVHVWGAIWHGGRSNLFFLEATVNRWSYIRLLQDFFRSGNLPENYLFQDDNAPAHRAAEVRHFHQASGIRCLRSWPAKSPDMNPIEHLWDYMARRISARPHTAVNLQQLRQWVVEEWRMVPQAYIDGLIGSMPRRLRATIEAGGGSTRY